jgi:hypothetical protein
MKKQRGYILLEAAIAGGITALGLAFALERIGDDRVRISNAANEANAVALASAKLNEILTQMPTLPPEQVDYTATGVPTGQAVVLKWRWRTTDNATTLWGAATPASRLITVQVSYPSDRGSRDDVADGTTDGRASVTLTRQWIDG